MFQWLGVGLARWVAELVAELAAAVEFLAVAQCIRLDSYPWQRLLFALQQVMERPKLHNRGGKDGFSCRVHAMRNGIDVPLMTGAAAGTMKI